MWVIHNLNLRSRTAFGELDYQPGLNADDNDDVDDFVDDDNDNYNNDDGVDNNDDAEGED